MIVQSDCNLLQAIKAFYSAPKSLRDWMTLIQQCIDKVCQSNCDPQYAVYLLSAIMQVGQPTDDYKNDPEGKPEGKLSKAMKGGAKLVSRMSKMLLTNAGK